MKGILACSALHLASLRPENGEAYTVLAAEYQEMAMPTFREAVAHLNVENCHAVLSFIHLLSIYSFAFEQEDERLLVVDPYGPEMMSKWLAFLHGGCHYVSLMRDYVTDGPLKALLCEWTKPRDLYEDVRTPLTDSLLNIIPPKENDDAWSARECQIYRDAVHKLGHAFLAAEKLGEDFTIWDALRGWPLMLPQAYFDLLRGLHPGALILLAHFCPLLYRLDGKWYLKGRAKRLLSQILQKLDTHWHSFVGLTLD